MKSNIGKRLVALCACTALTTGGALAANTVFEDIQVQYSDIKLVIDNVPVTPKDVTGTVVEPFIYQGTTYLPVRAVGEAIGKKVTWDGETKTVYLGEKPGDVSYLTDVCPPYETSGDSRSYQTLGFELFSIAGVAYSNGITIGQADYALFNLNAQYQSITMTMGPVDGTESPNNIYFIVDGNTIAEYTVEADDYPREITVPLNHGLQLKIAVDEKLGTIGLANIVVK